jgi:hypothetical protein
MKKAMVFLAAVCAFTLVNAQTFEATSNTISVDSSPKVVEVTPTLADLGITKVPTYHALIIGVSEYQHSGPGLPDLEMPAKDASSLYEILTNGYAFAKETVTLLKDPTREEIINKLDDLAEKVTDRDNLLIFYAGHGFYDKAKDFGYWLPSDAKTTSRSAWIANSTIKDYIGAIKSKHTLLITDACFGGSIFKTRSVESMVRRFNEQYKDRSRKALTSGNLTEVPDKSIFVQFLLKNLKENTDVFLSSSSLFSRIYEPILNNATTVPQYGVIQAAGDEGGDFIFIRQK